MNNILKKIILVFFAKIYNIKLRISKIIGSSILNTVKNKGVRCSFEGEGILIDQDNLTLGSYVSIGRNFFIRATGGISVGSYTHISRNVVLHTVNHNVNGELLPYDREDKFGDIKIGNYVWIGMNVNILPGVKIGDGAIIGMGTTVSKDVNDGEMVVSGSQRIIGKRDESHTNRLFIENKFLKI